MMDRKQETMLEAACCKLFATERLWQVANDALQVTGGTDMRVKDIRGN